MKPKTAVIIVTHNSELHIHKAMQHLQNQTLQANQVILVDSGSKDYSYLKPLQSLPNVELIFAEKDIGFCRGNNIGMEKIAPNTDYIFFLNPDAFLTDTFIEHAVGFMQKNHTYAALTGTVLGYDIHANQPTGKYDTTGVFTSWYGKWYDRDQGSAYEPGKYQITEDIPAICGAVLFCRKKALDSVLINGKEVLDNSFFMYKEDIDLSNRLRKKGWKLAYVPEIIAYHCRGWQRDRQKMPKELRLISARNELYIHARVKSPIGCAYSLLKYAAVKFWNF